MSLDERDRQADQAATAEWRGSATPERPIPVDQFGDRWRILAEWWRTEIHREYWQLALADGRMLGGGGTGDREESRLRVRRP